MNKIDINSAWQELESKVQNCNKCELCRTRNNVVFGEGPRENPLFVIVGEAATWAKISKSKVITENFVEKAFDFTLTFG